MLIDSRVIVDVSNPDSPWHEGFVGEAYLRHRRRQGTRIGVLSDFFIGAHAAGAGSRLVTRDVKRFSGCLPGVELLVPRGCPDGG